MYLSCARRAHGLCLAGTGLIDIMHDLPEMSSSEVIL